MMKKKLLQAMLAVFCFGVVLGCKPAEAPKPDISSETAEVEAKLQKFKATPNQAAKDEVDRALAGLNAKIKELEAREKRVSGAEKDQTVAKLTALRTQYSLYTVEVASVKVQAATGRALEKAEDAVKDAVEKAGDAMRKAADSVNDSLKSTNN
jgi:hypothetical protein